ncbi:MAG TPA: lipoyl(octanoyl) transferase LipB [Chloroflexota bacterium]|nr:lipoyl(octanoyl) transferase LipB [Chloroflexota bacterium]
MQLSSVAAQPRVEFGPLHVMDLGQIAYAEAVLLQDQLVEERLNDVIPDTLLLLEHPPVITLGRRASMADVHVSAAELAALGIDVQHATRGGLVTYHGPGQVIGYPIVKLRPRRLSVPCYVRALEQAIVAALAEIGVAAHIDAQHVGVWTATQGKIAAIGVAQRHGVTLHGLAVNLQPDLAHFSLINACGIGDLGVTSVAAVLGRPVDADDFKRRLARSLQACLAASACATAEL